MQASAGPWIADHLNHPKRNYRFRASGYICEIRRIYSWNWNGYVKLPAHHPDFGKHYSVLEDDIPVHGNLTYSGGGWFGFDTLHAGDIQPAMMFETLLMATMAGIEQRYWTFDMVLAETKQLAALFKIREEAKPVPESFGPQLHQLMEQFPALHSPRYFEEPKRVLECGLKESNDHETRLPKYLPAPIDADLRIVVQEPFVL